MDTMERETSRTGRELDKAKGRLLQEMEDGLRHGFFEFLVTCEVVKNGRRQLTIKAGKSHRFVIPEEDLQN